jgi:hypothetical protein
MVRFNREKGRTPESRVGGSELRAWVGTNECGSEAGLFPRIWGRENIRKMLTSVLYEIGMKHALEVITRKGVIRSGGLRVGTATSNTVQMLIVWHLNPLFRLIQ